MIQFLTWLVMLPVNFYMAAVFILLFPVAVVRGTTFDWWDQFSMILLSIFDPRGGC